MARFGFSLHSSLRPFPRRPDHRPPDQTVQEQRHVSQGPGENLMKPLPSPARKRQKRGEKRIFEMILMMCSEAEGAAPLSNRLMPREKDWRNTAMLNTAWMIAIAKMPTSLFFMCLLTTRFTASARARPPVGAGLRTLLFFVDAATRVFDKATCGIVPKILKEHSRRNSEAFAQGLDLAGIQFPFPTKDFRDDSLATDFRKIRLC